MENKNHRESEILSYEANKLMLEGNIEKARHLYAKAAELEKIALKSISPQKTRTFGILAVSAVALYYKSRDFNSTLEIAKELMEQQQLPDFARLQIQEILDEIQVNEIQREFYPAFQPGTLVRLLADPGRVGVITGRKRTVAGKVRWQVRFPDGADYHKDSHLEVVSESEEDPIELLRQGKLGRARDLRGSITHIRLSGRLANLIYSMGTTNTDFYPYQFKPVLNFLDSPGNGLLIADEVGLGKTIEAGLIWTELRSRYDIRRIMVLVPSMLQSKWEMELRRRFGIKADILASSEVLQYFKEYKSGERIDYAIICSMQGLRPRRGWDRNDELQDTASNLARFLENSQYDEPLLDLLIIDEAHYLRNPESMTARLGRLLRDVTDHIVLLSATPIHLKNRDLYQLLNLVDENTFNQPWVFDEILEANEPLLKAREAVLKGNINQVMFISLMEEAKKHPFFEGSRQIQALLEEAPSDEELQDNVFRSSIANRLESINLLGRTVTRTRKRDVESWRVVRDVFPEKVPLSEPERAFYRKVTDLIRDYAIEHGGYEAFLLVMPQRQMSSSMPAAIEDWQRRGKIDLEQIYEDVGVEDTNLELGPLTEQLVKEAFNMGNPEELRESDSKYFRLKTVLKRHLNDNPDEKIVLFAYFRPTLRYLKERLTKDGIDCIILMGGANIDKNEIIETFAAKDGPNVLLSSEVASEGVDLQFSQVLINYDLPWNPMKVEQRIGRIDRLGQKSERITIWNLFYEDTIDSRIYERLYERLDIFQRALGGLEGVLGDEIRKLTAELITAKLTPEQELARIKQTEQALANIRETEERLETEASNLVAHGDYILQQVKAAKELQRNISSQDIWNYIYDYFSKEYVGSDFVQLQTDDLVFNVKLSQQAKFDLERFLEKNRLHGHTRLSQSYPTLIKCRFKNQVGLERPGREETISQFHPLARFVSDRIKSSSFSYYSPVSVKLGRHEIPNIELCTYVFSVERWSVQGVRDIERLHFAVARFDPNISFLNEDDAEKIVTVAARDGKDWQSAISEVDFELAATIAEKCLERSEAKYEEYTRQLINENNDRADVQEKSLITHQNRQLEKLEALRNRQLMEGKEPIARMTQGRIDALNARIDQKLLQIRQRRELLHHKQEVCLGLIRVA